MKYKTYIQKYAIKRWIVYSEGCWIYQDANGHCNKYEPEKEWLNDYFWHGWDIKYISGKEIQNILMELL